MRHDEARHQKSVEQESIQQLEQLELPLEDRGEASSATRSGEAMPAVQGDERSGLDAMLLLERVVEGGNLRRALKRVQQNEGSPGVDGLTVDELAAYLRAHWVVIREQLSRGATSRAWEARAFQPGGGARLLRI
jgi:RNA-directed DNA polymerase